MLPLLGIADLISATLLLSQVYGIEIPSNIILIFAIYLIIKAIIFLLDIGSLFDIVGGSLLILSLYFQIPDILMLIAAGLIGFKGILTLFPRF